MVWRTQSQKKNLSIMTERLRLGRTNEVTRFSFYIILPIFTCLYFRVSNTQLKQSVERSEEDHLLKHILN